MLRYLLAPRAACKGSAVPFFHTPAYLKSPTICVETDLEMMKFTPSWIETWWHKEDLSQAQSSCRARFRQIDPAIILQQYKDAPPKLFGYPPDGRFPGLEVPHIGMANTGTPFLYLDGKIPAYVTYVMGDGWRSRLIPSTGDRDVHVILRPNVEVPDQTNTFSEKEHCLRMRRCDAVAVRSTFDMAQSGTMDWGPRYPEQLFGWPERGGVWILRQHPLNSERSSVDWSANPEGQKVAELVARELQFKSVFAALRKEKDMERLCLILEASGAYFYERVDDCPEALRLELFA